MKSISGNYYSITVDGNRIDSALYVGKKANGMSVYDVHGELISIDSFQTKPTAVYLSLVEEVKLQNKMKF